MLAGVAGGLAEHWDTDPSLIRILWAILAIVTGGLAVVVYIVMAIVVPDGATSAGDARTPGDPAGADPADPTARVASAPADPARRTRRRDPNQPNQAGLVFGALLILAGGYFLLRQFLPAIDIGAWWPAILIGLGVLLVVVAISPGRRHD